MASALSVLELDGVYSSLQVMLGLSLLQFFSLMALRAYLRSSSHLLTLCLSLMAFRAAFVLELDGVYSSLKAMVGLFLPLSLSLMAFWAYLRSCLASAYLYP